MAKNCKMQQYCQPNEIVIVLILFKDVVYLWLHEIIGVICQCPVLLKNQISGRFGTWNLFLSLGGYRSYDAFQSYNWRLNQRTHL